MSGGFKLREWEWVFKNSKIIRTNPFHRWNNRTTTFRSVDFSLYSSIKFSDHDLTITINVEFRVLCSNKIFAFYFQEQIPSNIYNKKLSSTGHRTNISIFQQLEINMVIL